MRSEYIYLIYIAIVGISLQVYLLGRGSVEF